MNSRMPRKLRGRKIRRPRVRPSREGTIAFVEEMRRLVTPEQARRTKKVFEELDRL